MIFFLNGFWCRIRLLPYLWLGFLASCGHIASDFDVSGRKGTTSFLKPQVFLKKYHLKYYLCPHNQIKKTMLQKGSKAPYFEGKDENGNTVKITDFAGKKLVLYFYPKDSTPGCTAEACDLRDNYERFLALGYNVLGVSRDSAASHQRFIAKYNLPFHLIADTDLSILKAYEAWGEKKMYGKVTEGTLRTTYIIDEQGIIIDAIGKVDTKNHTAQLLTAQ